MRVLVIIAQKNFRDEDFFEPKEILEVLTKRQL